MNLFYKESKFKRQKKNFFLGGGGGVEGRGMGDSK